MFKNWIGQSADGDTVLLRRFKGEFIKAPYANPTWIEENANNVRQALVVDVETTGLDKKRDTVIEIGVRKFFFNRSNGDLLAVGNSYQALQDPGKPLTEEVKRLTGLSDEMLYGQTIDWKKVLSFIEEASLVISHNASFDRPFIEKNISLQTEKVWGCTLKQIDWQSKGFGGRSLELLSIYHGFYSESHRALSDSDALLHLLSFQDSTTGKSYLNELLENARRPLVRILAKHSPFETKDLLKERGYYWELQGKYWYKNVPKERLTDEIAWMESAIYKGSFKGDAVEIPITENFRS